MATVVDITWDGTTLRAGHLVAEGALVRGFQERFGRFTGRAWLDVVGTGWRLPIGSGYGALRRQLRQAFPSVPFESDWTDGHFPGLPGGIPPDLAFLMGSVGALMIVVPGVFVAGPMAGGALLLAVSWPLSRLRDAIVVRPNGVRIGPPWAPLATWYEVSALRCAVRGRSSRVWVVAGNASAAVTVPTVLIPALRARVWRLGGLELKEGVEDLDQRYEQWRGPAAGIPWGVLVGTVLVAGWLPEPWTALVAGLLTVAATTMLGAAVEARATGWGTGAVLWLTGVYAVVLAAVAVGAAGWLG